MDSSVRMNKINIEILELAFKYIINMAQSKKYNLQSIAILNYFKNHDLKKYKYEHYLLNYSKFSKEYKFCYTKDFIYKNDYFTPREMYVISPEYYLYYTFNVFKYCYIKFKGNEVDFSKKNFFVFYSGYLNFKDDKFDGDKINYKYSYERFIKKRNSFSTGRVFSIDLQDFFKNIKIKKMKEKLIKHINGNFSIAEETIGNIIGFLENFDSLPQLHYSIASSLLSQYYLEDFTAEVNVILDKFPGSEAVRYVDDMYFLIPPYTRKKKENKLLEKLSYILWKDNLNINSKKTMKFSRGEFLKYIEKKHLHIESIQKDSTSFYHHKIDEKVQELIENDGEKLFEFVMELNELWKKEGFSLSEYSEILKTFIEVEHGGITKVFNQLMYAKAYKCVSVNVLRRILEDSSFIVFNPSQFTILFIIVNDYIRSKGESKDFLYKIEELVEEEIDLKKAIIISTMFLQKYKYSNFIEKLSYLTEVNKQYVKFIKKYILNNDECKVSKD